MVGLLRGLSSTVLIDGRGLGPLIRFLGREIS